MSVFDNILASATGGSLGTLVVRLTADSTNLVRGMAQAETAVKSTGARMLAQTKMLAVGVAGAGAALGALAVNEAIKFESSFAGVRKTVDATDEEFKILEKALRDLSKQSPASIHEINMVAEAAGQLGIEKKNIVDFTKTMLQMGTSTNLSANDAATQLARLANITGMSQKEFSNLGSSIVKLGNNLATTEAEIVSMSLRIAGAGRQIGLAQSDILALAGALSSVGLEAEAGGTAMSRLMIEMEKSVKSGSDSLELFAKTAGTNVKGFVKLFEEDASGALLAFLKGLRSISDEGGDVFTLLDNLGLGGTRLVDAMTRASGATEIFSNALQMSSDAWRDNNALSEEAEKRYETLASQLQITRNLITDIFITVGQKFLPVLKDVNSELQGFLKNDEAIEKLANNISTLIEAVVGFVKGVGWVLGGVMDFFRLYGIAILELAELIVSSIKWINEQISGLLDSTWEKFKRNSKSILEFGDKALLTGAKRLLGSDSAAEKFVGALHKAAGATKEELEGLGAAATKAANAVARATGTEGLLDFATESNVNRLASFEEKIQQLKIAQQELWNQIDGISDDVGKDIEQTETGIEEVGQAAKDAKAQVEDLDEAIKKMAKPQAALPPGVGPGILSAISAATMQKPLGDSIKATQMMDAVGSPKMGPQGWKRQMFGVDPMTSQAFRLEESLKENEEILKQLEEMGNSQVELTEKVEQRRLELMKEYAEERKRLILAEAQLAFEATSDMFNSMGEIAKTFAGEQSDIYKAMFAASKAFAVAESIVKIQQGIANAASLPFPANLAAMASVVAATASIVSTIQSVRLEFAGARERGGPVDRNRAYLVGEKGPELFIPDFQGMIVSNNETTKMLSVDPFAEEPATRDSAPHPTTRSGGASFSFGVAIASDAARDPEPIKIEINNYSDVRPQVRERQDGDTRVVEILLRKFKDEIGAEIRDGRGSITSALKDTFGLSRTGKTGR